MTELETLTRDRYHTLRLKLPSGWFENASMLPSNMSFDVTIKLASNNKMLICRVGDNAGEGALPAGNLGQPKYRIDHANVRLQIIYNTLPDGKDENGKQIAINKREVFERNFFSKGVTNFQPFTTFYVVATEPIVQNHAAVPLRLERILRLENRFNEHMIMGFVLNTELSENGAGLNANLNAFKPFSVEKVQVYVDGKALFDKGGILWQRDTGTMQDFHAAAADVLAHPDNQEARIDNPLGEMENMHNNRWLLYLNSAADRGSTLAHLGVNYVGTVDVEITFLAAADGGANHPNISLIFATPKRRTLALRDAVTNEWGAVEEVMPPAKLLSHVNIGRRFKTA